jgi:hypothetical protein
MSFGLSAATWGAIAAAAVSAAGTGFSVASQAAAQKKQADYQAQVDANNAKIAAWQRSDTLQRGEQEAQNQLRQQAQLIGTQRAALAANGVDVTEGSALDILATTRFLGAQDVAAIQSNAAREAWGYSNQQADSLNSSNFNKWQSKQQKPGLEGAIAGGSSLLSSASSYLTAKK